MSQLFLGVTRIALVSFVLGQFGGTKKRSIQAYRGFVGDEVGKGRNPALMGGGLIRSHGGVVSDSCSAKEGRDGVVG